MSIAIEEKERMQRVGRNLAYTGAILKVYQDEMQLPKGRFLLLIRGERDKRRE